MKLWLPEEEKKMKSSFNRVIKTKKPIKQVIVIPSGANGNGSLRHPDGNSDFLEGVAPAENMVRLPEEQYQQELQQQYQRGLEEGQRLGYQQAEKELQEQFHSLQALIHSLQEQQANLVQQSEKALLELTFRIAEKIVSTISSEQGDLIRHTLNKILRKEQLNNKLKIFVNPRDAEQVRGIEDSLRKTMPDLRHIGLIEDNSIACGGCLIESGLGKFDARIESQLSELEKELRKLFQKL